MSVPPQRTVAYGADPAQVYDVRQPSADPRSATVVVVHGGFWRKEYDRAHAAPQAQAFADAGYHVAVLEYRRSGMPGGGWPGTFADVTAGVAAVRADPTLPGRTVLIGHSAGGHLVALAAAQPWALGLAGVVSLAGVVDLARSREENLGDGAVEDFLGRTDAETITAADPAAHPPAVPVALLHGALDQTVPAHISQSYVDRITRSTAAHAEVRLTGIPDAWHMDVIDPAHPAFAVTLDALAELTRQ